MNQVPELLCPAGDASRLDAALRYGADAVYLSGKNHSLRPASAGFDPAALEAAFTAAAAFGARVYYCLNAFAGEDDLGQVRETLAEFSNQPGDKRPSALIVADPGVFRLARQIAPDIPVHVSTQANTTNSEAVRFWSDLGATRVNLARELNLAQMRRIMRRYPSLEYEVFVHGAMCLAVSGQCRLSAFLTGRSANRGDCAQPCRYDYRPVGLGLEERTRPGNVLWETRQDGDGFISILAAEDLCLVPVLAWFLRNAVTAVKIEGRAKSAGYVALVTDVYRSALGDLAKGRFRPRLYLEELAGFGRRAMGTGMFLPRRLHFSQDGFKPRVLLGRVEADQVGQAGSFTVAVRSLWETSQPIRLVMPGLKRPVLAAGSYALENALGERLAQAHPGVSATLRCDAPGLAAGVFLQSA